jgi:hypothetical protein
MRPPFRALPKRAAEKARSTAAGSPVPAGQEPPPPGAEAGPSVGDRREMRRRARKAAHLREALVRELGALVAEMNRLGRSNDELVTRKAREIDALDRQLTGLADALGERQTVGQVVLAGIAGSCAGCGTILGTGDRFCSHCGRAVAAAGDSAEPPPPPPPPPPPAQLQIEAVGAEPR